MKYCAELDGLRALAVSAVILFHADRYGPFKGGYIGVDLFFVLSGFLITSILAREPTQTGRIDLGGFYWRRFVRLMPALLFMLAGYLLAAPFLWPDYLDHGRDALIAGFYLSDYAVSFWQVPEIIGHTWSLSVEEHFYLIWPLLLVVVMRSKQPLAWLVPAYIAFTLWRFSFYPDLNALLRFDARLTGILLGAIVYFAEPKITRGLGVACLAALLCLCLFVGPEGGWFSITAAEIAGAGAVAASGQMRFLKSPILVRLGVLSYAVYLWHYPLAVYVRDRMDFAGAALVTFLFSVSMAVISYHTVEAWGRRVKASFQARLAT